MKISPSLLLEALTTPGVGAGYSYERLETLGDSFLKICVGLDLFMKHPDKSEGKRFLVFLLFPFVLIFLNELGQLSYTRHVIVSNKSLYQRASKLNLPLYIYHKSLATRDWRLATVHEPREIVIAMTGVTKHNYQEAQKIAGVDAMISDSTIADTVEALIGAALLSGGIQAALRMVLLFDLPVRPITHWTELTADIGVTIHGPAELPSDTLDISVSVDAVETILGYKFRHRQLLYESLHHPSSHQTVYRTYQRLEYLGDAVLDFLVVRHLFAIHYRDAASAGTHAFPQFIPTAAGQSKKENFPLDPGSLTDLKMLVRPFFVLNHEKVKELELNLVDC